MLESVTDFKTVLFLHIWKGSMALQICNCFFGFFKKMEAKEEQIVNTSPHTSLISVYIFSRHVNASSVPGSALGPVHITDKTDASVCPYGGEGGDRQSK